MSTSPEVYEARLTFHNAVELCRSQGLTLEKTLEQFYKKLKKQNLSIGFNYSSFGSLKAQYLRFAKELLPVEKSLNRWDKIHLQVSTDVKTMFKSLYK